jgi:hypothetical protein
MAANDDEADFLDKGHPEVAITAIVLFCIATLSLAVLFLRRFQ